MLGRSRRYNFEEALTKIPLHFIPEIAAGEQVRKKSKMGYSILLISMKMKVREVENIYS